MAINPATSFPGNIDTVSDPTGYPYGKGQNITAPAAGDGTPWEALIVNDILGFQQAMLAAAAIVPSGTPDKVGSSQYLTALQALFETAFSKNTAFNKDFGADAGDVPDIASTLANLSILETNASGQMITATKNTAYNKNIGTIAGTVAAGDDSRFPSSSLAARAYFAAGDIGGAPTGAMTITNGLNMATITKSNPTGSDAQFVCVFTSALSSTNYRVFIEVESDFQMYCPIITAGRTTAGFTFSIREAFNNVDVTAFRLYIFED
jgi:hypothetical protein